jgi:hypothetical protein
MKKFELQINICYTTRRKGMYLRICRSFESAKSLGLQTANLQITNPQITIKIGSANLQSATLTNLTNLQDHKFADLQFANRPSLLVLHVCKVRYVTQQQPP